jgi:hypothetical protein
VLPCCDCRVLPRLEVRRRVPQSHARHCLRGSRYGNGTTTTRYAPGLKKSSSPARFACAAIVD